MGEFHDKIETYLYELDDEIAAAMDAYFVKNPARHLNLTRDQLEYFRKFVTLHEPAFLNFKTKIRELITPKDETAG